MKLITAIIQNDKLDAVREALLTAEITRITVSRCSGHGQEQPDKAHYRSQAIVPDLLPKTRIDIACNDDYVDIAVNAILKSAKEGPGKIGDGKIFVTDLQRCIRIRTEETGNDAI